MNDFAKDLVYSCNETDNYLIDNFYKSKFPNLKDIEFVTDLEIQKKGIDKILTFKNGKQITIDEKKRRVDYGDILLEVWKNKELKRLGWLYTCQCDYISYIVMPTSKIYLLSTLLLQCAFKTNGKDWFNKYGLKHAKNAGYTTVNIGIPTEVLLAGIQNEIIGSLVN